MGARTQLPPDQELWASTENRTAVRFAYEYHDDSANCFRAYGNENWEFDADGLMRRRIASPASTSTRPPKRTGNFTGRSVAGQTNTPA